MTDDGVDEGAAVGGFWCLVVDGGGRDGKRDGGEGRGRVWEVMGGRGSETRRLRSAVAEVNDDHLRL